MGFSQTLKEHGVDLRRTALTTLQVNIGKLCNQACSHCHVEAGPGKIRENMDARAIERIVQLIDQQKTIKTVDITGGAPELNPNFKSFVTQLRQRGLHVIDRCNLTVLFEQGQEDTAEFIRDQGLHVVASLPCYSQDNVDRQRGDGVFDKSIRALQLLNKLGYAKEPGLTLDLVYNPLGASLPAPQQDLEQSYKLKLRTDFSIEFNNLLTITNMPIKRFKRDLDRQGQTESYMNLLVENFNPVAAKEVMCNSLVSVGWDGTIYDCDFNQMLELPLRTKNRTIWSIESLDEMINTPITLADHCYGCTAGAGSSCSGSLTS